MIRWCVVVLMAAACLARAESGEERLASGLVLLNEATQARLSEPEHAARLGADAAVLIASSMEEMGLDNPSAQRALGTAWLLAGDTGRAVLAFRRAELGAPDDALVQSSLAHARSVVGADVGTGGLDTGWRGLVLSWRHHVPRVGMFWGSLGVFVGCCFVIALRVLGVAPARVAGPAVAMGLLGAVALGVLAVEPAMTGSDAAVVVAEAAGRTGPHAEVYPAALDAPVPSGTEVRALETRDGWVRCAVGGLEAWLPGSAVERVRPLAGSGA
jgi:hypothetical protein